jgi:hypothetical protein
MMEDLKYTINPNIDDSDTDNNGNAANSDDDSLNYRIRQLADKWQKKLGQVELALHTQLGTEILLSARNASNSRLV